MILNKFSPKKIGVFCSNCCYFLQKFDPNIGFLEELGKLRPKHFRKIDSRVPHKQTNEQSDNLVEVPVAFHLWQVVSVGMRVHRLRRREHLWAVAALEGALLLLGRLLVAMS
jgi:hypothetical protein